MSIKIYKPTSAGRRGMTGVDFSVLTKSEPEKKLTKGKINTSARNNRGRLTTRHQGGGHKKLYRFIDFKQDKYNISGRIASIEYDPNRTAFIALVVYKDGEKRYILAPREIKIGDMVIVSENAPLQTGNRLMLKNIPVGTFVHSVEIFPGKGGQLARSAGSAVQVMAQEGGYTHLLLPSSEIRRVLDSGYASLGSLSNAEWNTITIGKAGRSRWLGIRPTVRASAMNPRDHKYGGGEGRSQRGTRRPKTKWGQITGGRKTRKKNKQSNKFIVRRRKKNK
ncbi:MAG: 50S ribosomal protein L2 [Candidatus Azambacteria bacterium GW2011_GWE1_42_9]|nr:MAG: 50S ribosomal protein L2 [Candidatus Azambacteria bacterium GW2011_GWF1_41_10]KKS49510.1 MAG: 50S ribosomal protein L2 [Candidatus Azambacteria bacterium GW2011_GWF2_42_22]KKS69615.1 MAG: 50S ribosomal protein L2 [Candidatus Azambacteria bacterium GW2011_GWA2_42_62]KKS74153.1 MAG: 50S ribosomal protein L2 [Candidatus Azambacteria bacterium GW2011_GWB1_42_72]KKS79527.1 MAG: 50S ribosomal protein L2 [Candidatus Azambacteria bacterium GW2011_GWE1_42_9]KKT03621.1 MAG: 50S ribosomal protein